MLLTPWIGPTPVVLLQDGVVLRDVSVSFAVVALHVTDVWPTTCMALPRPVICVALTEHERSSTYIVCTICRMSSSRKSRLSYLAVRTLSYSGGRAWRIMSSYLSWCTLCPICSRGSRHSSRTKKSSGSWPGSIFVLTSFSWHALLAYLVCPLYFSVRALHASCPCPALLVASTRNS